jgi:hypothetical protein
MVQRNDEGDFVADGGDRRPYAYEGETIERLLRREPLAPSGAACLRLAWQHADAVLG